MQEFADIVASRHLTFAEIRVLYALCYSTLLTRSLPTPTPTPIHRKYNEFIICARTFCKLLNTCERCKGISNSEFLKSSIGYNINKAEQQQTFLLILILPCILFIVISIISVYSTFATVLFNSRNHQAKYISEVKEWIFISLLFTILFLYLAFISKKYGYKFISVISILFSLL